MKKKILSLVACLFLFGATFVITYSVSADGGCDSCPPTDSKGCPCAGTISGPGGTNPKCLYQACKGDGGSVPVEEIEQ